MALNKLYDVYSLDTSCFYNDEELQLDIKLNKARRILNKLKQKYTTSENIKNSLDLLKTETDENKIKKIKTGIKKLINQYPNKLNYSDIVERCEFISYAEETYKKHIKILNNIISTTKNKLKEEISNNIGICRKAREEKLIDKNVVSIFDSNLTRSLEMDSDKLNLELIIIKVYYFDIMKSIINNGFFLNGEKYVFFSASAGQVRTKKFVATKETSLNKCWNQLTCGLTREEINIFGGVNTNKYLAYLALCNSATDVWEDFDIDKCIVVDDSETFVNGEVDFIDNETFEITRHVMDIPITQTDGCGMINYGNKNFMCRGPWTKGLLSPFRFHDFIKEHNCNPIIKDIYGKEYNIIEDDIQIIFTKSQIKMHKYYSSWDKYKENFKKYNCTFGICNEESTFEDTVISYQMLQTLTDVSDEELQYICKTTKNKIHRLSSDVETMLKVFGVHKRNQDKNSFQKCLEIYPELLKDPYTKETLKAIKNSLEKDAWAGKLNVYGKYTFIIPDLYAFCEYLFLGDKNPKGLLENNEVYCNLFKNSEKVCCLRSPHLYREWAVKNNVIKSKKELKNWFISNGVYISSHDLISKLIQCDFDGDTSLVIGDKKIVEIAERNIEGIVPLYYEMAKASPREINNENIYDGMTMAFTEGNIGTPSNEITKVWNSINIDLDVIKIQCAMVNFTIDAAKTLYKPVLPKEIQKKLNVYSRNKLPHFFIYAKDKSLSQVENPGIGIVDKIKKYIPPQKLNFRNKTLGEFNYKILMNNQSMIENETYVEIISKYKEITKNINLYMTKDNDKNNYNYIFRNIKNELLSICEDMDLLVDNLTYYLFFKTKTEFKYVFWQCFGDIVLKNIENNMKSDYIYCEKCGKRFFREHFNEHLCEKCRKYKKINKKTVICIDCGKEFEVNSKNTKSIRCDECYREYIKKYDRKRKKLQ